MPVSRDVKSDTIFSTTISSPACTSSTNSQGDVARSLDELGLELEAAAASEQPRPSGLGDPDVRLARLDVEADDLVVLPVAAHGHEVQVVERLVASDAGVADGAVERAGTSSRPDQFSGDECRLERGEVRVAHADEAALRHREDAAGVIAEAGAASQHAAVHVELQVMRDDVGVRVAEPRAAFGAEGHGQPVRRR